MAFLASLSACSLPEIWQWLGTQRNFGVWVGGSDLRISKILYIIGCLERLKGCRARRADLESETIMGKERLFSWVIWREA